MNIRQLVLWVGALAGAAVPVRAQPWRSAVVTDSVLQSLVAEVLDRNPDLRVRRAASQAAGRRVPPAGALSDPSLTVGAIDPFKSFHSIIQITASLEQEIPWPGTLGSRTDVARAAEDAARAESGVARRDVTAAVAEVYYRLRYLVTALATLGRQRQLLEASVQLSTTRYATGLAPQSDPLQAKLARDRLDAEESAVAGDSAAAVAELNALRDRPPSATLAVQPLDAEALRARLAPLPPTDSLVSLAIASNPRIATRRAQLAGAARTIQLERLAGRPDFSFMAEYQYNGRVPQTGGGFKLPNFASFFVGLRLPVWAGRKQHRLADAARADSLGAGAALRGEEAGLTRDVAQAAARTEAARRRLELLADGVVPAARAAVESVLRSYQVGRAEFITLLSVEDALYRAELEAAVVAAEYETQVVTLRELTGEESEP